MKRSTDAGLDLVGAIVGNGAGELDHLPGGPDHPPRRRCPRPTSVSSCSPASTPSAWPHSEDDGASVVRARADRGRSAASSPCPRVDRGSHDGRLHGAVSRRRPLHRRQRRARLQPPEFLVYKILSRRWRSHLERTHASIATARERSSLRARPGSVRPTKSSQIAVLLRENSRELNSVRDLLRRRGRRPGPSRDRAACAR